MTAVCLLGCFLAGCLVGVVVVAYSCAPTIVERDDRERLDRELIARRASMRWAYRALRVALSLPPDAMPQKYERYCMKQVMMAIGDGAPAIRAFAMAELNADQHSRRRSLAERN